MSDIDSPSNNHQHEDSGEIVSNRRSSSRSPARSHSRSPIRSPKRAENIGENEEGGYSPLDQSNGESSQRDEPIPESSNNLFITGLSKLTKEPALRAVFERYGTVTKCSIVIDPHTGDSRGFAFVSYDRKEDAEASMSAVSGVEVLDDRLISVEYARRGRARTPTPGKYHGPPKPTDRRRGRFDPRRARPDRRGSYRGGYADRGGFYDRRDRREDYRGRDYDYRPRYDDRRFDERRAPPRYERSRSGDRDDRRDYRSRRDYGEERR